MNTKWRERPVLITGGAGFLGANMARRLAAEGARVRAVDNLERGRLEHLAEIRDRIEFIELDLRDPAAARRAAEGMQVVFHFAARVGGIQVYLDRPGSVLLNNVLIDQNVFQAAVEARAASFVYAGSAHVYPEARQQAPDAAPLREEEAYPARPALTYGWGKLLGEITLEALAREHPWFRVSLARIMGAYGYHQDTDPATGSAIPVFCRRAARWPEGAPFRIRGTGRETRSYIFVDDVLDALLLSVEAQERLQVVGPFNLANEGRATIAEIAERVVQVSGKDIPLTFDPAVPTALWGQAADCSLARRLLGGWTPRVSLEEGLRRMYAHVGKREEPRNRQNTRKRS
ncbi:MAG TPA: SDR family NAD(P)-dependent oxidoreductase [Kiritimatiellia bacterium]|nr:SDR family NAD(P)-dependent oxidoreductase [Kiritimatiellia bacterium]HRZ13246.1 SDR family NAD(P)-dependent oxidoreductase [Kiritimatiellia bacterium]HSA18695.1 SDR family NAD(P)-dependent oxidoreductase [Kiritimatiellia bacterium]